MRFAYSEKPWALRTRAGACPCACHRQCQVTESVTGELVRKHERLALPVNQAVAFVQLLGQGKRLLAADAHPATGRRVAGLSEKGSTERLRGLWEDHANRALERAGRPERIDRRTLEAQGIARDPTVHEGPKAQQMERRGAQPESRARHYRNRPGSRLPHRQVDYRGIDGGRSRPAYNRHIRETPADYWQALDADNRARELEQLRAIHHRPDSVVVPFIGRREQPRHGVDVTRFGVRTGTGLDKPDALKPVSGSPLQPKNVNTPFEAQPPPDGQSLDKHTLMYSVPSGKGNDKMANRDDDDSEDSRRKAHEAKRNGLSKDFGDLVGNSYDDKDKAHQNMLDFGGKHGTEELYHALRFNPEEFGELPKDASKAREAPRFRRQLAPAFHDIGKAHDDGNRQGFGNQTPSTPGQGQQGLSSLWDRAPSASPSPTQFQPPSNPLESSQRPDQQGRGGTPPSQLLQQAYHLKAARRKSALCRCGSHAVLARMMSRQAE